MGPDSLFDAIVVAGCPPTPAGQPSENMRRRVDRAVALLRKGRAPLLLLTGGARKPTRPLEASVAAAYARKHHGIQDDALLHETESLTTEQNARFAARALRKRGIREPRVLVVSDRYHGHRCRLIFARHFAHVEVVSAGNPDWARLLPSLIKEVVALSWLRLTSPRPTGR